MGYGWDDDTGRSRTTPPPSRSTYDDARDAYRSTGGSRSSRSSSGRSGRSSGGASRRDYTRHSFVAGKTPAPVGKTISTDSTHPIVVGVDCTGSMSSKPGIILEKLALFGTEVSRIAPDYAITFSLVGDAGCDSYPLQVRDFDSGPALDTHLGELFPEGGGGPAPESYGLWAYYMLNHCDIPKAVKPVLMLILDSTPHEYVTPGEVKKYTGDTIQSRLSAASLFKKLAKKFSLYIVCSEGSGRSYWEGVVGNQNVIDLDEARDVVEILIGIVSGELGKFDEFSMRSSKRHSDRPDRVSRVSSALGSVAKKSKSISDADSDGKSTRSKSGKSKSKKSKKLI